MAGSAYVPSDSNSRVRNWMDQIEERLEIMETQQRLFNASVKGGAISVLKDEDASQVGRLGVGAYSTPAGVVQNEVLAISTNEGAFHLLIDTDYGWNTPRAQGHFVPDTFIPITAASYVNVLKTSISITGKVLVVTYLVTCDSGTVGKTRLTVNGQTSDEITINATEQKVCKFSWNLEERFGFGSDVLVRIQAYRVSGAGNVNVYSPDECHMAVSNMRSDATVGGIASGT